MKLKKLIAMLLCVCMLASLMPVYAFAEDDPAVPETPACEHDYVAGEVVESTCTAQGYTVYTCSLCGDVVYRDYTPAVPHMSEYVEAVPSTCTAAGKTEGHVCSVCVTVIDGCEPIEKAAHTPAAAEEIPATCAKEGRTAGTVCSVCGAVIDGCEPIEKTEHTPVEAAAVAPTCTEPGRTAGHVCEVCGEILDGCEPIEATGHTPIAVEEVPPEVGIPGCTAGHVCETCGEILDGCEPIDALEEETVITIEKQPEDAEPVEGEVIFSVIASVNTETEIRYQWQRLDLSAAYATEAEREAAWKDMKGETSSKLRLTGLDEEKALTGAMNYAYRCVITVGEATEKTKEAHILKPVRETKSGTKGGNEVASGTCGDNLTWSFDEDGILTISGAGDMSNYEYSIRVPWKTYFSSIKGVSIGPDVTSIGSYAFYSCTSLTSINIPEGVTRIGDYAFYSAGLTSVSIPSSVKTIGNYAFSNCSSLADVIIQDGVTSIGTMAFNSCSGLTSISLPSSVAILEESAFQFCTNITDIAFSTGLITIGKHAFNSCSSLVTIYLPDGLTTINNSAFANCTNLSAITIPASVTSIGPLYVFENDTNLTSITVDEQNSVFSSSEGVLYNKDKTTLLICPEGITGQFVVPTGVTQLSQYAFSNCNKLTDIQLPTGVSSIGSAAFRRCSNLNNITIPSTVSSIGDSAFEACSNLTEVTIPFGVNSIAESTFKDCSKLSSITIPATVTTIGNRGFYQCDKLANVWFGGTSTQWAAISIGNQNEWLTQAARHYAATTEIDSGTCGDNLTWFLDNMGTLTISGSGPMTDYRYVNTVDYDLAPWHANRSQIQSVVIESGVTSIGYYAFYECSSIVSIVIPPTIGSIGSWAFYGCSAMSKVYIQDISSWNSISRGDAGSYPFTYSNATEKYIYDNGTLITELIIPEGITSVGQGIFKDCNSLTSVTIPSSVTSIGGSAFRNCSILTSVTLTDNVASIGNTAFENCDGLTDVFFDGSADAWSETSIANGNECLISASIHYDQHSWGEPVYTWADDNSTVTASRSCLGNNVHIDSETVETTCEASVDPTFENEGFGTYTATFTNPAFEPQTKEAEIPKLVPEIIAGGNCAASSTGSLSWSFYNTGTLIISGMEKMKNYSSYDPAPWEEYKNDITSIRLEGGVQSIGNFAFSNCPGITSITISQYMESVGQYAFANCTNLKTVVINVSSITIGDNAFSGCTSITSAGPIGSGSDYEFAWTNDIPSYAFEGCSELERVNIPSGITSIGWGAFTGCSKINSIVLPDSITEIRESAFSDCTSLSDITIPSGATNFGSGAFSGCTSLTSAGPVGTDNSIQFGWTYEVPRYAFSGGNCLTTVTLPEGMVRILGQAFDGCSSLTSITIPSSINNIATGAFNSCTAFETVNFGGTQMQWNSITIGGSNEYLTGATINCSAIGAGECGSNLTWILDNDWVLTISGSGTMSDYEYNTSPWYSYRESIQSIVIGSEVTSLGQYAFYQFSNLTSITIPASITIIGSSAFTGCSSLTAVNYGGTQIQWDAMTIGAGNEALSSDIIHFAFVASGSCGDNLTWAFDEAGTLTISGTGDMTNYDNITYIPWADYRDSIQTVLIGNGVTSIGKNAFYNCSSMTSVSISDSITSINGYAFNSCRGLTEVFLPNNLTSIGYNTFEGCTGLIEITIPSGISSVGMCSFKGCSGLTSVTLQNGVTEISLNAFEGCSGLTALTIPNSVTSIGMEAFSGCSSLTSVTIPSSVTSILSGAFRNCISLTNVEIPNSVTNLGGSVFSGCSGLVAVTIPNSVTSIPSGVFSKCTSLTSVEIPNSVTSIENSAFNNCSNLASITIPDGVTSIGANAFQGCSSLLEIDIPSSLTSIDSSAFRNSGLTSVVIPVGVRSIGNYAFEKCSGLTNVTIEANVTSINDSTFADCTSLRSVSLPNSLTTIGKSAFYNCSRLTSISIPDGVTEIGESAFFNCSNLTSVTVPSSLISVGEYAFSYCNKLESVYITDLAAWCNIDFATQGSNPVVFSDALYLDGALLTDLVIPDGITIIKNYTFNDCACLAKVTIPEGVTSIGTCAFQGCTGLTSVSIPDEVTSIGNYAFWGCSSLVCVTIPVSLTDIGASAFSNCTGLTDVWYKGTEEQWEEMTISTGNYALTNARFHFGLTPIDFGTCGAKLTWTLDNEGTLTIRGTGDMDHYQSKPIPWASYQSSISNVIIEDGVKSIGTKAFSGCNAIETVSIPDGVTFIGWYAFNGCSRLTSITIPASVTEIGFQAFDGCVSLTSAGPLNSDCDYKFGWTTTIPKCAFKGCSGLTNVTFPESLSIVGEEAFSGCSSLVSVVIPEGTEAIEQYAFYNCSGLTSLTIPESVTSIGMDAFAHCSSLTSVTIPNSITSIAGSTFSNCTSLTNVEISDGVRIIGSYAFFGCSGLTSITIPASLTKIDEFAFANCSSLREVYYCGSRTQWNNVSVDVSNDYFLAATLYFSSYTISFDANGGAGAPDALTEKKGISLTLPDTIPTRDGYVFLGWAIDPNSTEAEYLPGESYTGEEDITLNAIWTLFVYTITYDANGGEAPPEPQAKIPGDTLILTEEIPLRKGFSFLGWATDPDATVAEYQPGSEYVQDSSITLYAIWTPLSYTVRFVGNGNTGGSSAAIQTTGDTAETPLPNGFIRTYYSFVSWNTAADGTGESFGETVNTVDLVGYADEQFVITLYAQWEPLHYSIAFDANGGEGEMDPQGMKYSVPAQLNASIFTRAGYTFTGWNTKANGKGTKYADGATVNNLAKEEGAVVTLYAQWKANTYTVVFDKSFDGATGTMKNQAMTYDKAVALTANAFKRTNYTFIGWSFVPVPDNTEDKNPDFADKQQVANLSPYAGDTVTLYAVWAKNCYRIVFNANGGTGDMSEESAWCEVDGYYKLPKNTFERPGFKFLGWAKKANAKVQDFDDEQEGVTGLATADGKVVNLYAVWAPLSYSITLEANYDGAPYGPAVMPDLVCGKSYKLTANSFTREGYYFTGWNTMPDGSGTAYADKGKVSFPQSITLYAQWHISGTYGIVLDPNYDGAPYEPVVMADNAFGKTVTLKGNSFKRDEYVFKGWSTDPEAEEPMFLNKAKVLNLCAEAGGSVTLYAVWESKTYKITYKNVTAAENLNPAVYAVDKGLALQDVSRPDVQFLGWYLDAKFTTRVTTIDKGHTGNVTLYAQWSTGAAYKYVIAFDGNGATSGKMSAMTKRVCGKDYTLTANKFKRTGYDFLGWSTDPLAEEPLFLNKEKVADLCAYDGETVTLYAVWRATVYTITYKNVYDNMPAKSSYTIEEGYELPVLVKEGYTFLGWYTTATFKAGTRVFRIGPGATGNITLYAKWQLQRTSSGD